MVKGNIAELKWEKVLRDGTYVNSADISSDGSRVIGGNFYHKYVENSDVKTAGSDDSKIYYFNI